MYSFINFSLSFWFYRRRRWRYRERHIFVCSKFKLPFQSPLWRKLLIPLFSSHITSLPQFRLPFSQYWTTLFIFRLNQKLLGQIINPHWIVWQRYIRNHLLGYTGDCAFLLCSGVSYCCLNFPAKSRLRRSQPNSTICIRLNTCIPRLNTRVLLWNIYLSKSLQSLVLKNFILIN